ncbi:hypothetical protein PTTG_30411 [Puccinia triticina 1-1 BBBD Race 1]|uniref:Uncharacterized protein n=1 Tax=Puccinia triticina (isolate 1-1 / race 1 (BBBD)) TaxID=630390 RepID=A0A180FYZ7_PUCT1|nr:hypothetical protein PTTG_30411 [Puccinia triticina 1-1 BBBD Race 1]
MINTTWPALPPFSPSQPLLPLSLKTDSPAQQPQPATQTKQTTDSFKAAVTQTRPQSVLGSFGLFQTPPSLLLTNRRRTITSNDPPRCLSLALDGLPDPHLRRGPILINLLD